MHIAVDYQLGIGNGLEAPDKEGGLETPIPTYSSKNDENDVTNHSKQKTFEVQDPGYQDEEYIVVEYEDSGVN
jgi:hypothetical protein